MSSGLGKMFLVLVAMFGSSLALDCLSCNWDVKNDTIDHDCLGAPYNLDTETCPEPPPGIKYACQINIKFKVTGSDKSMESVERKCKEIHSNCNKACLGDTEYCWTCCTDNDQCNSFPLSTNIVITSSAATPTGYAHRAALTSATVLLTTVWSLCTLYY